MSTKENIFDLYAQAYESQKQNRLSLKEYLEGCRSDRSMYASTAERMIAAIGEPEFVDTAKDARLGHIFMDRTPAGLPAARISGLEETIERIVDSSAMPRRGWRKRHFYLLGPGRRQIFARRPSRT